MKTINRDLLLEAVQGYLDSLTRDLYSVSSKSDRADVRSKIDLFGEVEATLLHEDDVQVSD